MKMKKKILYRKCICRNMLCYRTWSGDQLSRDNGSMVSQKIITSCRFNSARKVRTKIIIKKTWQIGNG